KLKNRELEKYLGDIQTKIVEAVAQPDIYRRGIVERIVSTPIVHDELRHYGMLNRELWGADYVPVVCPKAKNMGLKGHFHARALAAKCILSRVSQIQRGAFATKFH